MKKILLFVLSFICLKSFGQYPVNQSLGSDSTLVTSKGALKSRLINRPFSDTTQANTQRIKFYDGAQIWTTTDNKFWLRDSANNIWTQPGGSVTGANNGDTLIGGNIGLGGTLIRQTRVSASNNAFLLDSLGIGSTFKAYPNSSASVFRYFKIVNGNTSDSAYLWIGGKTAATTRSAQLGTNASVNNSKVEFGAINVSGSYVYGAIEATSPTRISYVKIDTLSAFMASIKTSPSASQSYIYMYPDSMTFYQTDGDYYVYNLNRITDSAGVDLMVLDRATKEWKVLPSDLVGSGGGATPNLQTVFAVESNSPVMTANANEIKLNPAGSSGVAKTFTLGATSFADDSRIFISNDGTGNGAFDVWAQDSANTNQVFLRSDITNKRVYLHSARGVASSANNLFVYSDSTVFQFTLGTADYRFKGVTDLFYTDTILNKPAVFDAQGRLRRLSYWPSGGGGGGDVTKVGTPVNNQVGVWTGDGTIEGDADFTFDGDLTTHLSAALGVTQSDAKGLLLINTTAAALGAQQISPSIHWGARGWETTGSTSQAVDFRAYLLPVQGTVANSTWLLQSAINGGAYTTRVSVSNLGSLTVTGADANQVVTFNNASSSYVNIVNTGANASAGVTIRGGSGTWYTFQHISSGDQFRLSNAGSVIYANWTYSNGNLALGQSSTAATAKLMIGPGTSTASTAPQKYTAGIVLATPETGAVETDAANDLYYTNAASATAGSRARIGMWGYIAKTATYPITNADNTIECTANTFTTTLPTAVGISGRQYVITNSGAGVITLATTSSQTFINVTGTPTTLTLNQFNTVIVQSNGANWLRISSL